MPTLSVTKSYADAETLTEAMLDEAFESIETFVNTTKLNSSNIQTGGVSEGNLGAGVVTEGKIGPGAVTTNKYAAESLTLSKLAAEVVARLVPAGTVTAFAGTSVPTGWLLCDGSAVSRTTYAALYSAIGLTHGQGDASTTFNVPDYRGRFLRGVDGGAGRDPDTASRTAMATGGNTGNNVGSVQTDQFKSHTHTATVTYTTSANDIGGGGVVSGSDTAQDVSITVSNSSAGGNETRPLNAYVNYIIKT